MTEHRERAERYRCSSSPIAGRTARRSAESLSSLYTMSKENVGVAPRLSYTSLVLGGHASSPNGEVDDLARGLKRGVALGHVQVAQRRGH
jgi:hypothetical protein